MPATNPTAARRPPTRAPVLVAELEEEDFDAVLDVVDDGCPAVVLEGEDDFEVEFEDGVPSAEEPLAIVWNSVNVSLSVGLTANTWPFWQWPVWAQWNHNELVSLMVIVNVSWSVELSATGSKPESMPPASGRHGVEKFDCVTEWLLEGNINVIVSPAWAVTLFGLKAPGSSVTWMSSANAEVAAPMARIAEARVKCIFNLFFFVLLPVDVRRNRSGKKGLVGQRSCGDVEGLAKTKSWRVGGQRRGEGDVPCSDHNNENERGKWLDGTE
jgi:hypothetical protein